MMKLYSVLAAVAMFSAFSSNPAHALLQVDDPIVFGTGSSNKETLEGVGGQTYITKALTITYDKQGGGQNTVSLKIKSLAANLTQNGGASSTKPVSHIEFSTNQSSWFPLSTSQQTIASGLPNPASGNHSVTVYLRIKVSFDDLVTNETGASWTLPTGQGGNTNNIEWETTTP